MAFHDLWKNHSNECAHVLLFPSVVLGLNPGTHTKLHPKPFGFLVLRWGLTALPRLAWSLCPSAFEQLGLQSCAPHLAVFSFYIIFYSAVLEVEMMRGIKLCVRNDWLAPVRFPCLKTTQRHTFQLGIRGNENLNFLVFLLGPQGWL